MKKTILTSIMIVLLAACSSEDFDGGTSVTGTAITFGTKTGTMTRADQLGNDAAASLGNNFVVYGVKGNGGYSNVSQFIEVFDNYNVNYVANSAGTTTTNSSNWEYAGQSVSTNPAPRVATTQITKYWDPTCLEYSFIAFSQGGATPRADVTISNVDFTKLGNADEPIYTISGTAEEMQKLYLSDLEQVQRDHYNDGPVTLRFRSMAAKVRMAIYETIPGYSVKDVKFYPSATATDDEASATACLYTDGTNKLASGQGTLNVYVPDQTKKNIVMKFMPQRDGDCTTQDFSTLALVGAEHDEASGSGYIGRASNVASYAGINDSDHDYAYVKVLPMGCKQELSLRVKFTLVSVDGHGETIEVGPIIAKVPDEFAEWRPNYAYTYLFKITDAGSGLYPVLFDAAEVYDGGPSSISGTSRMSITTYQSGEVVTKNNEYLSGSNIYVTVIDGNATAGGCLPLYLDQEHEDQGGYVRLFEATLTDGDNADISEITERYADICFRNGEHVEGSLNYTVQDEEGRVFTLTNRYNMISVTDNIPASDAPNKTAITLEGDRIVRITNPEAGKVYVVQYCNGEGNGEEYTYKVIKVAKNK